MLASGIHEAAREHFIHQVQYVKTALLVQSSQSRVERRLSYVVQFNTPATIAQITELVHSGSNRIVSE